MDDREQQRQLARNARQVQNLQVMLLVGMLVGGFVGIVIAAYVILPYTDGTFVGVIAALVAIPVCAFIGQRIVLALVAR